VLCGGMGKRMQEETHGRISKAELPISQPLVSGSSEARESVVGMLVRALARLRLVQTILLLTSNKWVAAHTELAALLARRYEIDVRCKTDHSTGDEFPPEALATLTEELGRNVDLGLATILLNADMLFSPQDLHHFMTSIRDSQPLIAEGVSDASPNLGIYFFSSDLAWRHLTREIAAKNVFELMGGLYQRVPIRSVKIDGPIYDCGSVAGYRQACKDGREGRLW